jgi:hypothetical protein
MSAAQDGPGRWEPTDMPGSIVRQLDIGRFGRFDGACRLFLKHCYVVNGTLPGRRHTRRRESAIYTGVVLRVVISQGIVNHMIE